MNVIGGASCRRAWDLYWGFGPTVSVMVREPLTHADARALADALRRWADGADAPARPSPTTTAPSLWSVPR